MRCVICRTVNNGTLLLQPVTLLRMHREMSVFLTAVVQALGFDVEDCAGWEYMFPGEQAASTNTEDHDEEYDRDTVLTLSFDAHCCHMDSYKAPCAPDRVKPPFVIFDIRVL